MSERKTSVIFNKTQNRRKCVKHYKAIVTTYCLSTVHTLMEIRKVAYFQFCSTLKKKIVFAFSYLTEGEVILLRWEVFLRKRQAVG